MARQFRRALAALAAILMVASVVTPLEAGRHQSETPPTTVPQPPPVQQPQQTQQARDGRRDGSHDRRPWWKNPKDMGEIGLTADQSATIDGIWKAGIDKYLALRRTVNELERALDETIRANTADISAFERQVNRIESKRAELNSMRTVMLYRMRRVLNAEQNEKFQAMADRRDADRRKQDADRRK